MTRQMCGAGQVRGKPTKSDLPPPQPRRPLQIAGAATIVDRALSSSLLVVAFHRALPNLSRSGLVHSMTAVLGRATRLACSFYRGGTSKGLLWSTSTLAPFAPLVRDRIICHAMGSPDPDKRQIDGLGGGISSLSKTAVVGAPDSKLGKLLQSRGASFAGVDFADDEQLASRREEDGIWCIVLVRCLSNGVQRWIGQAPAAISFRPSHSSACTRGTYDSLGSQKLSKRWWAGRPRWATDLRFRHACSSLARGRSCVPMYQSPCMLWGERRRGGQTWKGM